MRLLLDTCVLSEMQREDGSSSVMHRIRQFNPDDVYISAIVIGEVTKGIYLLPHGRKRRGLEIWLQGIIDRFEDRILPIDQDVAIYWGRHHAERQRAGVNLPVIDGMIAATAMVHGLHVATRNVRDFKAAGAKVFNPWD